MSPPTRGSGYTAQPKPITAFPEGALVTLDAVRDADARALLGALGLTYGSRARLCKIGVTCILQVRATRIGISRSVAESIHVVPVAQGNSTAG